MSWTRRLGRLALFSLTGLLSWPALAADFQPFGADTPARLRDGYAGRPYILVFWSATCPSCVAELPRWAERQRRASEVAIHLVNLDPPAERAAALALLRKRRADSLARWALADEVPERVYWAVDPAWHGETPYVRFYDRAHRATAVTGTLDPAWLANWLAANRRHP